MPLEKKPNKSENILVVSAIYLGSSEKKILVDKHSQQNRPGRDNLSSSNLSSRYANRRHRETETIVYNTVLNDTLTSMINKNHY